MFYSIVIASLSLVSCALLPEDNLPNFQERIVSGQPTTIDKYPFVVSVRLQNAHHCGGSIINAYTILTAAHCVLDRTPKELTVNAGATYKERSGVLRNVQTIKYPVKFSISTLDRDIAMLILTKPLVFNQFIAPVKLPEYLEQISPNTYGDVVGWGALSEAGNSPRQLQYATVKVINRNDCNDLYREVFPITRFMLCAQEANTDACQGDSGGPLVSNGTLIGIVSWGYGCARVEYPGVYTRTAAFRRWIDKNMIE